MVGFKGEILHEKGRTPFVFIEISGSTELLNQRAVLFYGHFDKQPHGSGWRSGLGPITPVVEGSKMYGRGVVDDGYSIYSVISSIKLLQVLGLPHPKCFITIEGSEESDEEDFIFYLNNVILKQKISPADRKAIELVFVIDSGGFSLDRLWMTSSVRGVIEATLKVKVLEEGVHSGEASGIVPESFRIIRQLLNRIEDSKNGEMTVPELNVCVPPECYAQCCKTAKAFPDDFL